VERRRAGAHLLERLAEVRFDILLHRAPAVELSIMLQHEVRHYFCVGLARPWMSV
jgi:hypothetical protein